MFQKLKLIAALFLSGAALLAQDIAGVAASLTAVQPIVTATGNVDLKLTIDVKANADLPGDLLTGVSLDVKVDDQPGSQVREAGKGGTVAVVAGTRIERSVSVPVARLLPNAAGAKLIYLTLSWPGLTGANCVVKVGPDASKLVLEDLDLAQTKVLLVTSMGEMTIALRADKAPGHVMNFLKLAKQGFYDGTKFHRVIRNFMVQGGDPKTKDDSKQAEWGTGDPGYKINAEFNDIKHVRGVLSMARGPDPNSAGSQFFIVHKDSGHLDGQYTAFGNLESGADVLDQIANTKCAGPQGSTPVTPVVLYQAIIVPAFKQK
jgi:peptidyl-prolyl cis-trans isomerase B (cyclophilin B)